MKTRNSKSRIEGTLILAVSLFLPMAGLAQVPVDDNGNVIGTYDTQDSAQKTGDENIPLLNQAELEELVGPIALYPDDLLAVVLPAATYPLQVVQAARFLQDLQSDPSLEPNPDWDDSVVALINYPEAVELLNEDLDWTWRLGEAVVAQQADVVTAVETFRNRAYAAGNLKSDGYQTVSNDEGIIEITPVNEEVIYVPYYEPRHVVVHQPRPVYHYYPTPCPVYYYPYSSGYAFNRGHFWGVTTAFSIGWASDHLRVFHHSYHGHPYYGRSYRDRWWYRRPSINVHNTVYINNHSGNRHQLGDYWRSNRDTRLRYSDQRITRSRNYPSRSRAASGTINPSSTVSSRRQTALRNDRQPAVSTNHEQRRAGTANRNNDRRQTFITGQRDSSQRERVVTVPDSRQVGAVERQRRAPEVNDRRGQTTSAGTYSRREPAQRQSNKHAERSDVVRQQTQLRRTQPNRQAPVVTAPVSRAPAVSRRQTRPTGVVRQTPRPQQHSQRATAVRQAPRQQTRRETVVRQPTQTQSQPASVNRKQATRDEGRRSQGRESSARDGARTRRR